MNILYSGHRFQRRILHAGFWAITSRMIDRFFTLVRTVILARLLSPNEFGLFGIALLTMSTLEAFSETGFKQALIQRREDITRLLDTAWSIQVIRGFVLALIIVIVAPYIAQFFGEPTATPYIRVIGLAVVFRGLTNIGVIYFQRDLQFHKRFIYQFSGTVFDIGVAIPFALITQSVWALVAGICAKNFVQMIVSYVIHSYRPAIWIDKGYARDLYTFGKWILGSRVMKYLITEGDDVFLGKVLGSTALGIYQVAFRLSNLPATELSNVISQVTFPTYASLQDRRAYVRYAYLRTLQATAFIAWPIAGGIIFLAKPFTVTFLGEKWLSMVPTLQVLSVWGAIRAIAGTTGPLFEGVGYPQLVTRIQLGKMVLLAVLIYPFTMGFGVLGTALAVTIDAILIDPIALYLVNGVVGSRVITMIRLVGLPLVATVLTFTGMILLSALLSIEWEISHIVLFVVLPGICYMLMITIMDSFAPNNLNFVRKNSLIRDIIKNFA